MTRNELRNGLYTHISSYYFCLCAPRNYRKNMVFMDFGIGSVWKSAQKAKGKSGQMGVQRVVLAWTFTIVFGLLARRSRMVPAEVWTFGGCFGLLGRQMFKNGLLVFWGGNEVVIVINLNFFNFNNTKN
jgi:hypothetical protein